MMDKDTINLLVNGGVPTVIGVGIIVIAAFPKMTSQMIQERDPNGEVKGWFSKMIEMINQ